MKKGPIWLKYSKKLSSRIENPLNSGLFTEADASSKGLRLVVGETGSIEGIDKIILYWLVDESDGVVADAKFQVYGLSALIGAADAACDLLVRKNYHQAGRISAELLDKQMRDRIDIPAFPDEVSRYLNLALEAIENAAEKCSDIPFADTYTAPPIDAIPGETRLYPGWEALSIPQQIQVIEEVMASDIRPYVELDAGGVQVLNVIQGKEVVIAYQGSCTTCHSATGATLTAIQQILRNCIHPELMVTPDLSSLNLSH